MPPTPPKPQEPRAKVRGWVGPFMVAAGLGSFNVLDSFSRRALLPQNPSLWEPSNQAPPHRVSHLSPPTNHLTEKEKAFVESKSFVLNASVCYKLIVPDGRQDGLKGRARSRGPPSCSGPGPAHCGQWGIHWGLIQ